MFGVRACLLLSALVAVAACKPAGLKQDAGRDAGLPPPDAGDDLDAGSHPDFALTGERPVFGPELCDNGLDDDGDGKVDEGCICKPGTEQGCFPDVARLAGIGTCTMGKQPCEGDQEFGGWGKCVGAVTPAGEACDGLDNDCDGTVDDGCACHIGERRGCYSGPAGTERLGTCHDGMQTCERGPGGIGSFWGGCAGDVLPDRDLCDGLDNDCNGTVDDGCACGAGDSRACYGGPPGTDTHVPCRAGRQQCITRASGSEWGPCEGQVLPGVELCDRVDNDCDGMVDDGCACTAGATRACYDGSAATRRVGVCADGAQTCVNGAGGVGSEWGPCGGGMLPGAETCNDLDDDCDGVVDDGCVCRRGQTRACYEGPAMTSGVGVCRAGTQGCVIEAGAARWGVCVGQTLPVAAGETCNGKDDDCDGQIDGMGRPCGSDVGECRKGTETCRVGAWGACVGGTGPAAEDCNGGDEDCDGVVDDGCECFDGTTRACGPAAVGACRRGSETCVGGRWGTCAGGVGPAAETCNSIDDDCDGIIDNGCVCIAGDTRTCYSGPAGTAGRGPCRSGTQMCIVKAGVAAWGTCAGEVVPVAEICNGADDDCNGLPDDGLSTPPQVVTPRPQNRNLDLLFMVDDSASMEKSQASLVANFPILMNTLRGFPGGLPDLHIGVVTSDLGAGVEARWGGCAPRGKGGIFRAPAGCLATSDAFIIASNNEATKNYAGTIDQAFSCLATVGTSGCGFEHQLASAAVSLGFWGTTPAANVGFLRPDALLAVAFITNEDDCSAPPDAQIFDASIPGGTSPYGAYTFRCNYMGHLCGGMKPPLTGLPPVTLSDCRSAEDGVLYRVSELAAFFKSLKPDPAMLFVSAIAGPAVPYGVEFRATSGLGGEIAPYVTHSCTRADGSYADPAVRMAEFVAQFGGNGSMTSLCDDSYAPALTQLGNAIGRAFTSHCLDASVADSNPTVPGIQASCDVVLHAPSATDQVLPQCDMASPSGGPQPCWYLTSNTTCTSGVLFAVNRTGATRAGETISIRCGSCR